MWANLDNDIVTISLKRQAVISRRFIASLVQWHSHILYYNVSSYTIYILYIHKIKIKNTQRFRYGPRRVGVKLSSIAANLRQTQFHRVNNNNNNNRIIMATRLTCCRLAAEKGVRGRRHRDRIRVYEFIFYNERVKFFLLLGLDQMRIVLCEKSKINNTWTLVRLNKNFVNIFLDWKNTRFNMYDFKCKIEWK